MFYGANQAILMLSGGIFPLDVFVPRVARDPERPAVQVPVFYPANIHPTAGSADEILTGAAVSSCGSRY